MLFSQHKLLSKIIDACDLPIGIPAKLRREIGPETEKPLAGMWAFMTGRGGEIASSFGKYFLQACARAGAGVIIPDGMHEKYYLASMKIDSSTPIQRQILTKSLDILIYDATLFDKIEDLENLFSCLKKWSLKISPCGRILILGKNPEVANETDDKKPVRYAITESLTSFVRAYSKETGRNGTTVHLILIPQSHQKLIFDPIARFLASGRSAYITGQTWKISQPKSFNGNFNPVNSLKGKVAIITGASRGIGYACAKRLHEEGAEVILIDLPEQKDQLHKVASELSGFPLITDLRWPASPDYVTRKIKENFLEVDIVVHNAGVYLEMELKKMTLKEWKAVWDTNLSAAIRLTEALLPHIQNGGGGRIIAIGSISGLAGVGGQTCYSGSKGGLSGYMKGLAEILKKRNITANTIAAGYIQTSLTSKIPRWQKEIGKRASALMQGGIPEDIGNLVAFLAGAGGAFLNGQTIRACGGHIIGA